MGQTSEFGLRYPDISGYVRDTPAYIQNLAEDVENVLTDFEPSGGGDTLPIGVILPHGSSTIPTGYLECNGQLVSRTDYSELFEMIGTAWGEGDGSTTFAVPDMRKRVPVGLDTSDEDFDTIGKIGGEKEHTLTIDEMPSHKHGYDYDQTQGSNTGGLKTGTNNAYGGTTKATGGGQPHNIMQPYTVTCYIIKAKMGATVTKGNIIDSLDGESKIDAPSVNAVNKGLKINIVTGEECATNEYIDGKQIFVKRIDIGNLPNGTVNVRKIIDTGISRSETTIYKFEGMAKISDVFYMLPNLSLATSLADLGENSVAIILQDQDGTGYWKISVTCQSDRSNYTGYVNIYYTKN